MREDDVAAHVKQKALGRDIGAGQAARLRLLQQQQPRWGGPDGYPAGAGLRRCDAGPL